MFIERRLGAVLCERLDAVDLEPEHRFIVYPGRESYPVGGGTTAIPLNELVEMLVESAR